MVAALSTYYCVLVSPPGCLSVPSVCGHEMHRPASTPYDHKYLSLIGFNVQHSWELFANRSYFGYSRPLSLNGREGFVETRTRDIRLGERCVRG